MQKLFSQQTPQRRALEQHCGRKSKKAEDQWHLLLGSCQEKKCAPNELELLAIKRAIEHLKYQPMGRKFTMETDHKALLPIFNKSCIEKQYSGRLIRRRQRLFPYNFEVVY